MNTASENAKLAVEFYSSEKKIPLQLYNFGLGTRHCNCVIYNGSINFFLFFSFFSFF